jgi:hypothetical protein
MISSNFLNSCTSFHDFNVRLVSSIINLELSFDQKLIEFVTKQIECKIVFLSLSDSIIQKRNWLKLLYCVFGYQCRYFESYMSLLLIEIFPIQVKNHQKWRCQSFQTKQILKILRLSILECLLVIWIHFNVQKQTSKGCFNVMGDLQVSWKSLKCQTRTFSVAISVVE